MKTIPTVILGAVIAAAGARAGENIVLPDRTGGFEHRGTSTASQTFNVNLPEVAHFTEYYADTGLQGSHRIEVPINVPQFDGSLGTLVAINITLDGFIDSYIGVEAIGILDAMQDHEAGFFTNDTLFSGTAGYPVVGLLQRPTQDERGIAPNFYPIGSIGVYCYGIPQDMDACADEDWYDTPAGTTVDVFIFEDQNGPIYTLDDWIGAGFVPEFTVFVDNPNNFADPQFEFDLFNVGSAYGWIDTQLTNPVLTIEYVYEIDQPDSDGDGVIDILDNCTLVANPSQLDTNGDGYGNACDPDLNNDGTVNAIDLGIFRQAFFSPGVTDTDFNGDGTTNAIDLGVMKVLYFQPPGPSGLVP